MRCQAIRTCRPLRDRSGPSRCNEDAITVVEECSAVPHETVPDLSNIRFTERHVCWTHMMAHKNPHRSAPLCFAEEEES